MANADPDKEQVKPPKPIGLEQVLVTMGNLVVPPRVLGDDGKVSLEDSEVLDVMAHVQPFERGAVDGEIAEWLGELPVKQSLPERTDGRITVSARHREVLQFLGSSTIPEERLPVAR